MCSGSEAGSYSRLIDFVYHSTLGLRAMKKKKNNPTRGTSLIRNSQGLCELGTMVMRESIRSSVSSGSVRVETTGDLV